MPYVWILAQCYISPSDNTEIGTISFQYIALLSLEMLPPNHSFSLPIQSHTEIFSRNTPLLQK